MLHTRTRGMLPLIGLLAQVLVGTGCFLPRVDVLVSPDQLSVTAGRRYTVMVSTSLRDCDGHRQPCDEINVPYDFVVEDLPAGVTYNVDTSLQSPNTPGVVRIAFDIGPQGVSDRTTVRIVAQLDGRILGGSELDFIPTHPTVPLPAAVAVAAATAHSTVVMADGTVAEWGSIGDSVPTVVNGLTDRVGAVAAGFAHTLALSSQGTIWAWGLNDSGQLGDGTTITPLDRATPRRVPGLQNIQGVAAGAFHSLALTTDGTVWAWGANSEGQLGNGTLTDSSVPVQVQNLSGVRAIAAGGRSSLAVAADGTVWTWGRDSLPVDGADVLTFPIQVLGLSGIQTIATEKGAALALDSSGRVWGWGDNLYGQLGDGTQIDRRTPAVVEGVRNVIAIAMGRSHAMALTAQGDVWGWGLVLDGGQTIQPVPSRIPGLTDVKALAAGADHGLVVKSCGQVWAWGRNNFGQLGVGHSSNAITEPTLVARISDDTGCDRVGLRVSLSGTHLHPHAVTAAPAGLIVVGRGFVGTYATGTTVDLAAQPILTFEDESFSFEAWDRDCQGTSPQITIVLDRTMECVAMYRNLAEEPFLLTVLNGGGRVTSRADVLIDDFAIDCGHVCSAIIHASTTITLTAEAEGFEFTGWSGDCTGATPEISFRMEHTRICAASFRPFNVDLTVSGGGTVKSVPVGLLCGSICTLAPRTGTATLFAEASPGWQFDGWSGDCAGTATQTTITIDADKSCAATFSRIPGLFFLNVVVEGDGSVTSQPAGIACPGTCVALFAAGTAVELIAHETSASTLSFWLDDCAAPGTPTHTIVINADKQCRARFVGRPAVPIPAFAFTVPARVGGVVTFDATASFVFDPVTGTQDPSGIRSFAWDFDNDGAFGPSGSRAAAAVAQYAFQTVGDHTVQLRVRGGPFDEAADTIHVVHVQQAGGPLFALAVNKAGTGHGLVTTSPPELVLCGFSCTTAGPLLLEADTTVTLTASAFSGSTFAGWSGAGCTGVNAAIQLTMTAARTCTATFLDNPFTLAVNNGGNGVVASNPAGIHCGADCDERYDSGRLVQLTAAPNPGFQVSAWTGCDTVNGNVCDLLMSADRMVGVTFSSLPGPFMLTVVVNEPAGSIGRVIAVQPLTSAINCRDASGPVCAETFPAGTSVVVRPSDASIELGIFSGWSGCDSVGGLFACTVNMTRDRTIVATFSQ